MPLLKRKPFALLEPPKDLQPSELVYQVRFTKEIFCDYHGYLKRIDLYRRRLWTCKVTGKSNLTYEEALVSEMHATAKVQQFPKDLVKPVLQTVQFSLLPLRDLVNAIASRLQERLFEGVELFGKKDNNVYPCKIVKVLEEGIDKNQYEVLWLAKDGELSESSIVNKEDLIQQKLPFSRKFLMSFIRESTRQNSPWVLHDRLAQKHGIPTDPPDELRKVIVLQNGHVVFKKKRKIDDGGQNILEAKEVNLGNCKRKKPESGNLEGLSMWRRAEKGGDILEEEPLKYPIDDLLVQPDADDSCLSIRPTPSREFNVPMDCVGDLLMVWDFCSSFGKFLHLCPFSLEDFENAISHKDSNLVIVMEAHATILRLLIKDNREYFRAIQKKKRKSKITLVTWTEYLCDFLEMIDIPELFAYMATIKRGHYGLLEARAKLEILRELVAQAISTDLFKEMLDGNIEQRQALGATRRGQALEEAKKKRDEKERLKLEFNNTNGHHFDSVGSNLSGDDHHEQNGDATVKRDKNSLPSGQKHELGNSDGKQSKHEMEKRSKEQRKEYFEREIEKRIIRACPLGKDRNYNRYWFFQRDGRIFIESSDFKQWGFYSTKEELDALIGSLNCKGMRERALHKQLNTFYRSMCLELQKRMKEASQRIAMDDAIVRRSTRVRAPPRNNPAVAFLKYVNKWKDD